MILDATGRLHGLTETEYHCYMLLYTYVLDEASQEGQQLQSLILNDLMQKKLISPIVINIGLLCPIENTDWLTVCLNSSRYYKKNTH